MHENIFEVHAPPEPREREHSVCLRELSVREVLEAALCSTAESTRGARGERDAEDAARQLALWLVRGARLDDGRSLTLRLLLCWRLQLSDQLCFELGEERYAAGCFDATAKKLFVQLESAVCPSPNRKSL